MHILEIIAEKTVTEVFEGKKEACLVFSLSLLLLVIKFQGEISKIRRDI